MDNMDSSRRKLQLTELEIAKKFVAFCDEHNLRYFMLGGTFLGAVRHRGFIPWDDDMDFGLLREDYDKLLKLCVDGQVPFEAHNYFIDHNDLNHYRYFLRVEDQSVRVHRTFSESEEITSVWIDIFPLDGMPNGTLMCLLRKYYILWRRLTYKFSCFSHYVNTKRKGRPFVERALIKVGYFFPVEKMFRFEREMEKLDRALRKNSPQTSNYYVNAMSGHKFKEMFRKEVYGEGAFYDFEGLHLRGPQDSHTYLSQLYGDFMTPPPESERNQHNIESIVTNDEQ